MSQIGTLGAVGAAAAAAIANAIKASGAIVRVEPEEFLTILGRTEAPLVVYSPKKFLTPHKYLTSYKGLIFFTRTKNWLELAEGIEVVTAKTIWVPST